ncbi:MAG: carbonic anhydrase [Candidatus Methanomethylicaceae archaeon]
MRQEEIYFRLSSHYGRGLPADKVKKHNSKVVAIVAHYDCAGNPVGKYVQIQQLIKAIREIKSWDYDVDVIGLWVNDKWQIDEVY